MWVFVIFLKHKKHDLLADWSYFCRCVEDRHQRDPIWGQSIPKIGRIQLVLCMFRLWNTLLPFAMGDLECFTVSALVHFWASEMGPVLYMFRLWSSPWPVPNVDCLTVSTCAISKPQPHIGKVEWGLYWYSLPCSCHRTHETCTRHSSDEMLVAHSIS